MPENKVGDKLIIWADGKEPNRECWHIKRSNISGFLIDCLFGRETTLVECYFFNFIEKYLICNVMLVSDVQQI